MWQARQSPSSNNVQKARNISFIRSLVLHGEFNTRHLDVPVRPLGQPCRNLQDIWVIIQRASTSDLMVDLKVVYEFVDDTAAIALCKHRPRGPDVRVDQLCAHSSAALAGVLDLQ